MRTRSPQLRGVVALVAMCLFSCGTVRFVKSAYTVRNLKVTYSLQEDLTIFQWELGDSIDTDSVRFELFQDGNWTPIAFETAPFPAGSFECEGATCYRWAMRGRYKPSLSFQPLH